MNTGDRNRWQLNSWRNKTNESVLKSANGKCNATSINSINKSRSAQCLMEIMNMGINEKEDVLLKLLKEHKYDVQRTVNHYFEFGAVINGKKILSTGITDIFGSDSNTGVNPYTIDSGTSKSDDAVKSAVPHSILGENEMQRRVSHANATSKTVATSGTINVEIFDVLDDTSNDACSVGPPDTAVSSFDDNAAHDSTMSDALKRSIDEFRSQCVANSISISPTVLPNVNVDTMQAGSRMLGSDFHMLGYRTIHGHAVCRGYAIRNQEVTIQMDGQQTSNKNYKSMKKADSMQNMTDVRFGSGVSTAGKQKAASELLFSCDSGGDNSNGGSLQGRLPQWCCRFLVPLLKCGFIRLKASIAYDVGVVNTFDMVPVSLYVVATNDFLNWKRSLDSSDPQNATSLCQYNELHGGTSTEGAWGAGRSKGKKSKFQASGTGSSKNGNRVNSFLFNTQHPVSSNGVEVIAYRLYNKVAVGDAMNDLLTWLLKGESKFLEEFNRIEESVRASLAHTVACRSSKCEVPPQSKMFSTVPSSDLELDTGELVGEQTEHIESYMGLEARNTESLPMAVQPRMLRFKKKGKADKDQLVMKKYQLQALHWMRVREGRSGADSNGAVDLNAKAEEQITLAESGAVCSPHLRDAKPYLPKSGGAITICVGDAGSLSQSRPSLLTTSCLTSSTEESSADCLWYRLYAYSLPVCLSRQLKAPETPGICWDELRAPDILKMMEYEQTRIDSHNRHLCVNPVVIEVYWNPYRSVLQLTKPLPPASCNGGILADDMGMGKTLMMISLIADEKEAESVIANEDKVDSGASYGVPTSSSVEEIELMDTDVSNCEDCSDSELGSDSDASARFSDSVISSGHSYNRNKYTRKCRGRVVEHYRKKAKTEAGTGKVHERTKNGSENVNAMRTRLCSGFVPEPMSSGDSSCVGGTLIVCPMTLMDQWVNEIIKMTGGGGNGGTRSGIASKERNEKNLSVKMYYGSEMRGASSVHTINYVNANVVVTSYGVLVSECKKLRDWVSHTKTGVGKDDSFFSELLGPRTDSGNCDGLGSDGGNKELMRCSPIFGMKWKRVVLDEAHVIKNTNTEVAKACYMLQSRSRWVLTGTPIQNNLNDMYSLIRFLRHEPWDQYHWWRKKVLEPLEQTDKVKQADDDDGGSGATALRKLLHEIMLRRTKNEIDASTGLCIVELPKKHMHVVYIDMNRCELDFYRTVVDYSKVEFNSYLASVMGLKNKYIQLFAMLTRLRQICDHPYLALGSDSSGDECQGNGNSKGSSDVSASSSAMSGGELRKHSLNNNINNPYRQENGCKIGLKDGCSSSTSNSKDSWGCLARKKGPSNDSDPAESFKNLGADGLNDVNEVDTEQVASMGKDFLRTLYKKLSGVSSEMDLSAEANDGSNDKTLDTTVACTNPPIFPENSGYISEVMALMSDYTTAGSGASADGALVQRECPLCLSDFPLHDMCITKCGHIYCISCIYSTVGADELKSCPICSTPVTLQDSVVRESNGDVMLLKGLLSEKVHFVGTEDKYNARMNAAAVMSDRCTPVCIEGAQLCNDVCEKNDKENCAKNLQRTARGTENDFPSTKSVSMVIELEDSSDGFETGADIKAIGGAMSTPKHLSRTPPRPPLVLGGLEWRTSSKIDAIMHRLHRLLVFNDIAPSKVGTSEHTVNHPSPSIQVVGSRATQVKDNPESDFDCDSQLHKIVIFSQWTTMLDLIQTAIKIKTEEYHSSIANCIDTAADKAIYMGYKCFQRLDGSMNQEQRSKALHAFNNNSNCRILLVSLRAGGVGLNLTAASCVILTDPWWNPAVEDQAIDRIHRLGQTREVHVYRLFIRNSVEQQLLRLQESKRKLSDFVIGNRMDLDKDSDSANSNVHMSKENLMNMSHNARSAASNTGVDSTVSSGVPNTDLTADTVTGGKSNKLTIDDLKQFFM